MRKSIRLWLWLLVAAMAFTACSDKEDAVDVSEVNKQTTLVFMPWSGSATNAGLYPIFKQNLDSIEWAIVRARGLSGRLVVFLSTSATESQLYEVKYSRGTITHEPIRNYSGTDYTSPAGITRILQDVQSNAYALNYAMMVGCHGSGWTYKDDWTNYPAQSKRQGKVARGERKEERGERGAESDEPKEESGERREEREVSALRNKRLTRTSLSPLPSPSTPLSSRGIPLFSLPYPLSSQSSTRFFGSVTDMANAIDIADLAAGIQGAGIKMQYIMFDDCYMANIETAYELRNATNFLIGSTSEVMAIGIPYQTVWGALAKSTPAYETAIKAFNTYYKAYAYPFGALSAIDCREVEALATLMHEANSRYTLPDSLRDSLQVLDGFATPIFYDMGDYADRLCQSPTLLSDLRSQLSKVVRATATTDTLYSDLGLGIRYIKVRKYSGLTISDPSLNAVALKGRAKTAWWKATH